MLILTLEDILTFIILKNRYIVISFILSFSLYFYFNHKLNYKINNRRTPIDLALSTAHSY